jgi:hypothetical protein
MKTGQIKTEKVKGENGEFFTDITAAFLPKGEKSVITIGFRYAGHTNNLRGLVEKVVGDRGSDDLVDGYQGQAPPGVSDVRVW